MQIQPKRRSDRNFMFRYPLCASVVAISLLIFATSLHAQTERGWSLEVLVQDDNDRPVADAAVELVFHDTTRVLASATTNIRGRATVEIPTRQPVELAPLNLFLYTEVDRHAPELQALSGSPERMFTVRLKKTLDKDWARRTGQALKRLLDTGAQVIDVLMPAGGGPSVPVAPLTTGDPCDALPPGLNQCIRCPNLTMPTVVVNGRVAFGRYKGKTRRELNLHCGNASL